MVITWSRKSRGTVPLSKIFVCSPRVEQDLAIALFAKIGSFHKKEKTEIADGLLAVDCTIFKGYNIPYPNPLPPPFTS